MVDAGLVYFLNIAMITRVALLLRDNPVSPGKTAIITVAQLMGILIFQNGGGLLILATGVLIINLFIYFADRNHTLWARAGSFVALFLIAAAVFSKPVGLPVHESVSGMITGIVDALPFGPAVTQRTLSLLQLQLMGLLLATTEANVWIRIILNYCGASPTHSRIDRWRNRRRPMEAWRNPIDKAEYQTGRIIGILERTLIYILILGGQFTAIGFIMAAKGFTRFKELDRRDFAEYVLVGTLCSTLFAVIIGATVRHVLNQP